MAYRSYLVEKFDTTHENRFFRELNEIFRNKYENENGDFLFVGNLNVRGHSVDAVFIKSGAIVVIDLKDYSGSLQFSENGPWKLKDENNRMIFVSGGAKSRNPFQQVNAYRFALFQYLSESSNQILENNHDNISWDHTNGMVLFHNSIQYDLNEIPDKIKRYFHISDKNNVVNHLNDLNSNKLQLSDSEIQKILDVLHIGEEARYDLRENEEDIVEVDNRIDPARMDRIRQLIPVIDNNNKRISSLAYYNTMIGIERMNEASVSDIMPYPINWSEVNEDSFVINLETHPAFHALFRANRQQNFPKSLFVSIDLLLEEITVPLLYTVIVNSEINDLTAIKVNFNEFILFRAVLTELELTEDVIEELAAIVNDKTGLSEKINAARDFLDVGLELVNRISLGLSSESIFTAQLQSELNQWIKGKQNIQENKLFDGFLLKDKLFNNNIQFGGEIIQITELNPSQQKAVELSFKQKLTVITGPPGTGKSQVVTNILANAVYHGQKVLFASKNNQAVDNVHQRINSILNTDYFLRMGTNQHNADLQTKLGTFIQKRRNNEYPDQSTELISRKEEYKNLAREKRGLEERLDSIPNLLIKLDEEKDRLNNEKQTFEHWLKEQSEDARHLYLEFDEKLEVKNAELNELEQQLVKARKGGLSGIIFKTFKKGAIQKRIEKINEDQSSRLQTYIDNNAPMIGKETNLIESLLGNIRFIQKQKEIQTTIKGQNTTLLSKINEAKQNFEETQIVLSEYQENEHNMKDRIAEISEEFLPSGLELLRLSINENIRNASVEFIDGYKNYLDNGLPWQDQEKHACSIVIDNFLNSFKTISITSLTVKKAFLLEPEIFDLLVIDEASQCDIASALPLLYRAKRAVIIGDPLQLPHITSVKKFEQQYVLEKLELPTSNYNYVNNSLFALADSISNISGLESEFLEEHYRCHPDIIGFSNYYFYNLIAGQGLTIRTKKEDFQYGNPGIHWIDVRGAMHDTRNVNQLEVQKCVSLAQTLALQHPDASIGIVTPFNHQKQAVLQAISDLPEETNIVCDTVHRFQGDEKDIMIMSLVVTENCRPTLPRFINRYSPYLLNVGITRARSALYIVGNKEYCLSLIDEHGRSLLANLAYHEMSVNN
jgi:hypothetical protein